MDETYDYLKELFINEAKPALGRHSGGGVELNNQDLAITENGTYTAEEGYTGLGTVTVSVASAGDADFIGVLDRTAANPILPEGLTSIGMYAFARCANLVLPSLPSGLTSIGMYAFDRCAKLALTSLPSGLTSIDMYAFNECTSLALTSLPSGLTNINDYAFYQCTNIALTSLPSSIQTIGANAFRYCSGLTTMTLPSSIQTINAYAFANCSGLNSVTFEGTPTSIANTVFYTTTQLATINVPWAEGAVSGAPWGATKATINYNYTGE